MSPPEFRPGALLHRLADAEVDFVVIGGVAVAVQGYGRATQDLDITYATDAENLERLGGVLLGLHARLRGVDDDVPFVPDARTLRWVQLLTLDTDEGALYLLVDPAGAAPYADLRTRADRIELDGRDPHRRARRPGGDEACGRTATGSRGRRGARDCTALARRASALAWIAEMASPQTLTTPQRLAAIREQMSLLTDYL